jgi:predicted phosphodiesterase
MKVKVVSDAHSNYPALKKAVESDDGEDFLVYCGDIIGLKGFPSETVDLLMEEFDVVVKGNHDIAVLEKDEGHVNSPELSQFEHDYTKENLSDEQQNFVKNLSAYEEFTLDGKDALVAHAKPTSTKESRGLRELSPSEKSKRLGISNQRKDYNYVSSGGVMPKEFTHYASMLSDEYDYVFLGHTHFQHSVDAEKFGNDVLMVNPGSVGQKHQEQLSYSVVSTEDNTVTEKQIEVDESAFDRKFQDYPVSKKDIVG